jgi:tetratricopeptide (TPR) repeat protein
MRLAIALAEGGDALSERGDHAGALADFRRAIAQFDLLLQRRPGDEQYLANLVAALGNCAQAEFASGDVGAARATTARALELSRARKGGENQRTLIELLGHAADLALREDVAQARALMTEAEQRAKTWLAEREEDPVRQVTAALTAVNAGTMYLTLQDHEAAMAAWTAALPVARAANGRAGPMGRQLLALLLLRLCDVCVRDGRLPEARDWFQKAIAETSVKRSEMERYDPVPALFDRPDFQDLLQPGKGAK